MAKKKSSSQGKNTNGKNGRKNEKIEESGTLWPVIGAAIVLILIVAAILLTAQEDSDYPAETTTQAANEAFRNRGVSEVILSDLVTDFTSGNYTLDALVEKYPGFEEDIKAVNAELSVPKDGAVVTVNGVEITRVELDTQLALLPQQYRDILSDEEVLQEMIDEKLLLEEAEKRGITVGEAELELAYQELLANSALSEEDLAANLAAFGLGLEDMRNMLKRQATIDKLFAETVDQDLTPDPLAAKVYYDENKQNFQTTEQATVKHILFAVSETTTMSDALSDAEAALARYEAGDDFCDLVIEFTADLGSKDTCGEYSFPRGFMVPEFEIASFEMSEGETRIVETQFGQHLILKGKHQEAETKPFNEVEADIVALLAGDARRLAYLELIQGLRDQATIVFPDEAEETETTEATEETTEEETEETPAETELEIQPVPEVPEEAEDTNEPVSEELETETTYDIVPIPVVELEAPEVPEEPVESKPEYEIVPIPEVEEPAPVEPVEEPVVEEPVGCPEDAKVCPDGSVVVRMEPDCEFETCPIVLDPVVEVEEPAPQPEVELSDCTAVKLYTAEWATASLDQAAKYGAKVTVLDCTGADEAACAGVDAFPSWDIDGTMHLGSLEEYELAALAGC